MRILFGVLAVLMLLFAAVQYNDPDGPIWMIVYGVPAVWTALAAFRPDRLQRQTSRALLALSLATAMILTIILWPPVGGWWRNDVWTMETAAGSPAGIIAEQAREGMGIMIATAVLLAVSAWTFLRRPGSPASKTPAGSEVR